MRKLLGIFTLVLVWGLFFSGTGVEPNQDPFVGIWERQNDAFKGMKIMVRRTDRSYMTFIVKVPKGCEGYGFSKHDQKWKIVKRISSEQFEIEDLTTIGNRYSKSFVKRYDRAMLKLDEQKIIKVIAETDYNSWVGMEQIWKKVH